MTLQIVQSEKYIDKLTSNKIIFRTINFVCFNPQKKIWYSVKYGVCSACKSPNGVSDINEIKALTARMCLKITKTYLLAHFRVLTLSLQSAHCTNDVIRRHGIWMTIPFEGVWVMFFFFFVAVSWKPLIENQFISELMQASASYWGED